MRSKEEIFADLQKMYGAVWFIGHDGHTADQEEKDYAQTRDRVSRDFSSSLVALDGVFSPKEVYMQLRREYVERFGDKPSALPEYLEYEPQPRPPDINALPLGITF